MEIKITLKQVFDGQKTLQRILNTPVEVKTAYRMTKLANILLRTFKEVEEIRIKLVEKYGVKGEKEGDISVPQAKIKEFTAEFESLLEMEIVIDIQPLPWECLKKLEISAVDFVLIGKFIQEPTEADLK